MKYVEIYLDEDGYEAYRVVYTKLENVKDPELRGAFEKMKPGEIRQVGDAILEVFA